MSNEFRHQVIDLLRNAADRLERAEIDSLDFTLRDRDISEIEYTIQKNEKTGESFQVELNPHCKIRIIVPPYDHDPAVSNFMFS